MKENRKSSDYGFCFLFALPISALVAVCLSVLSIAIQSHKMEVAFEVEKQAETEQIVETEKIHQELLRAQKSAEACGFDRNNVKKVQIFDLRYGPLKRDIREGYLFEDDNEYFINGILISKADFYPCDGYNSIVILKDGRYCPSLSTEDSFVVQYSDASYKIYTAATL